MGYGKDIYDRALAELSLRRQRAINDAEKRCNRIYAEIPEVAELQKFLTQTGVIAARAVIGGGNTREILEDLKKKNLQTQEKIKLLLLSHGYSATDLEEHWFCPSCKDKGYVDGRMCACLKTLLRDTAFRDLNERSPLSLEKSKFENFNLDWYPDVPDKNGFIPKKRMEKTLEFCRNYAENFSSESPSILMDGGTGLGKTHLSLAIAGRVTERGFGVIYGSAPDILGAIERERFSSQYRQDSEILDRLTNCDLLILDDLGTEFSNQFTKTTVYNLINARMIRHKATIINTNLSIGELGKEYSDRLVSRLVGENIRLTFLGDDIRILRKKNRKQ